MWVARPSRTSTQHKHMLSPIRSNLKVSYSGGVPMSAFGTKRTLGDRVPMSAFGGKADMTRMSAFDPKRTLAVRFCCDAQRPNSLYWDMFRTREDAQCPFQYVRHKQSTLLTVDVPSMRPSRRSQPSKTAPYTVCGTCMRRFRLFMVESIFTCLHARWEHQSLCLNNIKVAPNSIPMR